MNYDLWYQRLIRLLGVVLGTGIAVWETLADKANHPWAFFASIAFMGLPAAKLTEDALRLLTNSSEPEKTKIEVDTKPRTRKR